MRFKQRLDPTGKIYIRKILRDAGFSPVVEILPKSAAALMYPVDADIQDVLASLEIIAQELEVSARQKRTNPNLMGRFAK